MNIAVNNLVLLRRCDLRTHNQAKRKNLRFSIISGKPDNKISRRALLMFSEYLATFDL